MRPVLIRTALLIGLCVLLPGGSAIAQVTMEPPVEITITPLAKTYRVGESIQVVYSIKNVGLSVIRVPTHMASGCAPVIGFNIKAANGQSRPAKRDCIMDYVYAKDWDVIGAVRKLWTSVAPGYSYGTTIAAEVFPNAPGEYKLTGYYRKIRDGFRLEELSAIRHSDLNAVLDDHESEPVSITILPASGNRPGPGIEHPRKP